MLNLFKIFSYLLKVPFFSFCNSFLIAKEACPKKIISSSLRKHRKITRLFEVKFSKNLFVSIYKKTAHGDHKLHVKMAFSV